MWIIDDIANSIKQWLIDAIMDSFDGMFDAVNRHVNEIAEQAGKTPEGWDFGVFTMVKALSETIVLPIAGIILTFVMCYELIQIIIEKNNLHEFDTFNIFKWIFKTFVAVFILTNTFDIIMGIFELAQSMVDQSAMGINLGLKIGNDSMMENILIQLEAMDNGALMGLFVETQIVKIGMEIMAIIIFIVVFGRMLEIYLVMSVAPIPMATLANREWGQIGNNYFKTLIALGFQGFLIMVCMAIYAFLVWVVPVYGDMHGALWSVVSYTVLLCLMLMRTGALSKSLFGAH